ncbi:MAG: outer membrane beta-barrel protein [Pseudomonadales bacterium]|nr:outer membrane beta-barrel protein [Pseudomonadales bacterium]
MKKVWRSMVMVVCLAVSTNILAEAGDFLVRVGGHQVDPKSNNHDIVKVDSAIMLTFNGTYFLTDVLAVEVLAALPFSHDIDLVGGSKVAEAKQLPPTVSLQYHLLPGSGVRPYIGAGLNVTLFFDEGTTGALSDSHLSLGTSVGFAAQIGVDIDLTEKLFLNLDARYMDLSTKAKLDGASIGKVEVDPWVYGISLGYRF